MLSFLLGLVFLAVTVWLASRVLQRAGLSPWFALLGLVPIVNLIALWVFAWARWPALDGPTGGPAGGSTPGGGGPVTPRDV